MDPALERIVDFLSREQVRATYGAVGAAIGVSPRTVGRLLGDRTPRASWVVRKDTGRPTGYSPRDVHPALHSDPEVITDGVQLLRRMRRSNSR